MSRRPAVDGPAGPNDAAAEYSAIVGRIRRAFGIVVAPLGLLALVPMAILIFTARTASGKLAGWAALSACVAAGAAIHLLVSPTRDALTIAAIVAPTLATIGLVALLIRRAPTGVSPENSGLRSVFPDRSEFRRTSVWNLIPEVDQVTLGAAMLTRLDPWMSIEHARRTRRVLRELYDEMEAVPESHSLGPVANHGVAELLGQSFQHLTHYYAYVPERRPDDRLGMIVFLHGNGGNHKVMAWVWKPLADQYGLAIVCPTFGFGSWDWGGVEAVERVYQHALATLPIDHDRVWLGGLSNGGKGVTRSAAADPGRYRGLIYLSPTLLLSEIGSQQFLDGWRGRPILIFQGDEDHSVLKRDVDPAADLMRQSGINLAYESYPGEDHFLFFARRHEIFGVIAARLVEI